MSDHRARIDLVNLLVGHGNRIPTTACTVVKAEFDAVCTAHAVPTEPARWLLQIVHACRGLDTYLSTFIRSQNYNNWHSATGLGGYLYRLKDGIGNPPTHRLPENDRQHFQDEIVDTRNRFFHNAGVYPSDLREVRELLAEMEACLLEVCTL